MQFQFALTDGKPMLINFETLSIFIMTPPRPKKQYFIYNLQQDNRYRFDMNPKRIIGIGIGMIISVEPYNNYKQVPGLSQIFQVRAFKTPEL